MHTAALRGAHKLQEGHVHTRTLTLTHSQVCGGAFTHALSHQLNHRSAVALSHTHSHTNPLTGLRWRFHTRTLTPTHSQVCGGAFTHALSHQPTHRSAVALSCTTAAAPAPSPSAPSEAGSAQGPDVAALLLFSPPLHHSQGGAG